MRLTAIVPATDDPATLPRCRAAVEAAAEPPEEIVVVREPNGAGPAAARNAGAARARGDLLVFVDSDVEVHADAFARIRAAFDTDPDVTAVFGSYDDSPDADTLVSSFRNLLHHHVHQQAAGPVKSFWAGLGAVRRDAFEAAGGFDAERYPLSSIEDIELGLRLVDQGAQIELDPHLLGKHLKRWTLAEMVRTDVLRRGAPWVELLLARREIPAELNLSWRHRLGTAAWLAVATGLAARRPAAVAVSLAAAGVANWPFYALLTRRLGPRKAIAGAGLHGLHYVAGAASVPLGALQAAARRRG